MTLDEAREVLKNTAEIDQLKRIEEAGNDLLNAIRKNIEKHFYNFEEDGDDFVKAIKEDREYACEVLTDGVLDKFIKYVEICCEE